MNRESLEKFCARGILALVLAILVFTPLAFGGRSQPAIGSSLDFILVNPFNLVEWMTLGIIVLWAARLWLHPHPKLLWPPACWAVLAFAAYAVIRYLTADIEYIARGEMIQALTYAFLFLAIVNNLQRQKFVQIITLTLVFLAMAISFYGIYQYVAHSRKVWVLLTPYRHQATGTFISPNDLAGFLEMILPLAVAYTLTSRMKAVPKVLTGYASLAILAGIVVAVSRGGWISAGLALVILFVVLMFHHTYRLPALALLAAVVIAGLYFTPRDVFFNSRVSQLKELQNRPAADSRVIIWRAAVKLWRENPVWGIGPGHFNSRFGKYRPELIQASPERVHNDYLNTLTDWGIVGLVLVAAALVLVYLGAFRTWRFVRGSPNTLGEHRSNKLTLVLGASIGLLAIVLHSFVDFNMHIPANAMVAVALMALLTSHIRFATERYWFTARLGAKTLLTAMLAAGLIYLGWQATRSASESLALIRAQKAAPASAEQIAALEKAFSVESHNADTARAIGEAFRLQSWQNNDDYKEKASEAMKWFKRATELNPYDDSSYLRYGMCLDQIGEHDQALAYFDRANRMDPNSYFNNAYMGWHYVQAGDPAAARPWLERSHMLEWEDNPVADSYLRIAQNQLLEAATNSSPLQFHPGASQTVIPPWNKN